MDVWCINTFKLEHARTNRGSKETWLSFIQREIWVHTWWSSSDILAVCLMSKAGYWEDLPWWFVDEDSMLSPWQFLSFFYGARGKNQHHFRTKITNWHEKNLLGYSHTSPHTWNLHCWATELHVHGVQVSFRSCSSTKTYRGVVVGVAHMFVGIVCLPFSLIFSWNG